MVCVCLYIVYVCGVCVVIYGVCVWYKLRCFCRFTEAREGYRCPALSLWTLFPGDIVSHWTWTSAGGPQAAGTPSSVRVPRLPVCGGSHLTSYVDAGGCFAPQALSPVEPSPLPVCTWLVSGKSSQKNAMKWVRAEGWGMLRPCLHCSDQSREPHRTLSTWFFYLKRLHLPPTANSVWLYLLLVMWWCCLLSAHSRMLENQQRLIFPGLEWLRDAFVHVLYTNVLTCVWVHKWMHTWPVWCGGHGFMSGDLCTCSLHLIMNPALTIWLTWLASELWELICKD